MKIILALFFCLIITVSSESENSKTKTANDQKIDNSAFIQKFLTPLHHDINQRYGLKEAEYNHEGMLRNYNNGYHDYNDENEQYLRNEGRPMESDRPHSNEPNINWGYSRNVVELENLMSHVINGEPYDWDNLRNSKGRMRNIGASDGRDGYNSFSRNEGTLRKGQLDMRHRNKGYGNIGLGIMLQNLNIPLKPEHNIGYTGNVDPKENGIKEKYYFRLIGRKGLGFDKRTSTSYGLTAPITPSLLTVVGRNHHNHNLYYYNEAY